MFRVSGSAVPPDAALALLEAAPDPWLRPRWLRAVRAAYPRFHQRYLVLEDDGEVGGVLPLAESRRWGWREVISLPFGTHGGPVLAEGVPAAGVELLAREFLGRARGAGTLRWEMTVAGASEEAGGALRSVLGAHEIEGRTLVIDLEGGPEALWERYEGRARTSVRKSAKSGVTVAVERGDAAVDALHAMHAAQGSAREVPWHHRRDALAAVAAALGDDARFWVARRDGAPVCAALVVYHPGHSAIPWVTGATPEARPLNAFPHLMHEAMGDAAARGYPRWDFGASAGSERVEYFKRAFGARPRPLLRFFHEAGWIRRARALRP